jgi:hypothetical protein
MGGARHPRDLVEAEKDKKWRSLVLYSGAHIVGVYNPGLRRRRRRRPTRNRHGAKEQSGTRDRPARAARSSPALLSVVVKTRSARHVWQPSKSKPNSVLDFFP